MLELKSLRTLRQSMAVMNMIERYDKVLIHKSFPSEGLPDHYLSGTYSLDGRDIQFGISPEGDIST